MCGASGRHWTTARNASERRTVTVCSPRPRRYGFLAVVARSVGRCLRSGLVAAAHCHDSAAQESNFSLLFEQNKNKNDKPSYTVERNRISCPQNFLQNFLLSRASTRRGIDLSLRPRASYLCVCGSTTQALLPYGHYTHKLSSTPIRPLHFLSRCMAAAPV